MKKRKHSLFKCFFGWQSKPMVTFYCTKKQAQFFLFCIFVILFESEVNKLISAKNKRETFGSSNLQFLKSRCI
jgi:hypothetical protein